MSGRSCKTALRRIWAFLCSRRVTAALLLATAAILIVALGVPQVPGELDAAGRTQWWEATRARFGESAGWMARLGLFDLVNTPLFAALLAALLLNNLACTVQRLGRLWREFTQRPVVRLPDGAYRPVGPEAIGLSGERVPSSEQIRRALRRRGFHPVEEAEGRRYFYGESLRLVPLGTLLTHVSLFLFVLAALLHTQGSWREYLILDPADGEGVALVHRPGCRVRNDALAASRAQEAFLSDQVALSIEEGSRTTAGRAWPGTPLAACGANLYYLDGHDLVLAVDAASTDGSPVDVVLDNGPFLRFHGSEEPVDRFAVPDWGWHVTVSPSPQAMAGSPQGTLTLEAVSAAGQMRNEGVKVGEAWEGPWGRLTFWGGQIAEVAAVYDPGVGPFMAGGATLLVGSALGLLFPRRRRWARLDADGTLWLGGGPVEGTQNARGGGRGAI